MEDVARSPEKLNLQEVQRLFAHWRETRVKGRGRIPADLWQKAIDLVGPHTVNEVARGLKLSHRELKNRYEAQHSPVGAAANPPTPGFVELPWHAPTHGVTDCVLEVESCQGRKLKLTVRDERAALDLLALAKGLWEMTA